MPSPPRTASRSAASCAAACRSSSRCCATAAPAAQESRPVAQPARQSIAADLPAAGQRRGDTAMSERAPPRLDHGCRAAAGCHGRCCCCRAAARAQEQSAGTQIYVLRPDAGSARSAPARRWSAACRSCCRWPPRGWRPTASWCCARDSGSTTTAPRAGPRTAPVVLQTLVIEALRHPAALPWSRRTAAVRCRVPAEPGAAHFEAEYRDGGPPTVHVSLVGSAGAARHARRRGQL